MAPTGEEREDKSDSGPHVVSASGSNTTDLLCCDQVRRGLNLRTLDWLLEPRDIAGQHKERRWTYPTISPQWSVFKASLAPCPGMLLIRTIRQAHHYQQMLDAIGASLVEWGHPSLTEEEQARLIAASESAELAHRSHAQVLQSVKIAIDILHPRMPKPKSAMSE
jgi:hypothetical protein